MTANQIHQAARTKVIDTLVQIRDEAALALAVLPAAKHGTASEKRLENQLEFARRKLGEFGVRG